jgi:two-component system cell cycle response regulator DivK
MAGARVLIVESDTAVARALTVLLQHWGYQVETAADPIEALSATSRRLPAAIVGDVGLPGREGVLVARVLKADPATLAVPVIGIRAEDDSVVQAARTAGCVDCLREPLDTHQLLALLRLVTATP